MLLSVVTLLGAVVRFARLAYPNAYVFDEVYYAKDACLYLGRGMKFCGTSQATEQSYVHPPLGKWIIMVGIKAFGFNTFGWRIMAAIFGTALIVVVFFLGRRLLGRWGGAVAGLLVATDFLLIVQSRVAMLDIFLTFFVALGFLFVVLERERVLRMRAAGGGRLELRWRLAAGAAFGAAASVKWSGGYALGGAGILIVVWTVATALRIRRSEFEGDRHRAPSPLTELNFTIAAMAVPALAIYLLSYGVWFYDNKFSVSQFLSLQNSMLQYHLHLRQHHAYASPAWKWPILWRPVAYYFTGGPKATHILAFGNPAVWWLALAAFLWLAYKAIFRRDVLSVILVVAWLSQYLPWAAFARPQFFFYMAPIVPFMMLGVAVMLRDIVTGYRKEGALVAACLGLAAIATAAVLLWVHPFGFGVDLAGQRRIVEVAGVPFLVLGIAFALGYSRATLTYRKILVGAYLALACGAVLFYFYPVIAAYGIPFAQWQHRMLFPTWI